MFTLFSVGEKLLSTGLRCPQPLISKGNSLMLKYYVKASDLLERLRTDKDGVVSIEYVIVAACIVGVVVVAFGTGGPLATALSDGLTAIGGKITTAVNG
jgi:Flp pilus assembly pilin Flp